MNTLVGELQSIVEKIKKFRSLYEQNEMAVREQIVNPILRNLEWNPENPEEVQPNVFTDEGVPDYFLLKNGKRILSVEAEKLSVDIEQKEVTRQLAKYSLSEGIRHGVLTNGAVWILIRSFEEDASLAERIVWKTDLENEESSAVIRKLTAISKTNIEQIEILVKKAQILDEIWQSLLDKPEGMIKGLMPVVKSLIGQGYRKYHFEDAEIEDWLKERVKKIVSKLPGEQIEPAEEAQEWLERFGVSPEGELLERQRTDLSIRREIRWESETASDVEVGQKEVDLIKLHGSNDPAIGYQRPKFKP